MAETKEMLDHIVNSAGNSPVAYVVGIVGGKWKIEILCVLSTGIKRFNELQRQLSPVTQRMLTKQLRELEQDGLIHREVYPVIPPKVEYSLTELGSSLSGIMQQLAEWGLKNREQIETNRASG